MISKVIEWSKGLHQQHVFWNTCWSHFRMDVICKEPSGTL